MESRLWNHLQLNQAVAQADNDPSEERLERSSTDLSSLRSLVQKQTAPACHVDKCSSLATTKRMTAYTKADDPFDPVKSPDFSVHSPTMLDLLSRRRPRMKLGAHCLPSINVSEEEAREVNYEYGDYTSRSDHASTPMKKRARPVARRNSVVIHRRQGDIASMLQDLLTTNMVSSPICGESAMPPILNRNVTESPLNLPGIASDVFPSLRGTKKRKAYPDHKRQDESEE